MRRSLRKGGVMNLFARIGLFLVEMTSYFSPSIMNFDENEWAYCGATAAWLFFIFSVTLNGPYSADPFSDLESGPFPMDW